MYFGNNLNPGQQDLYKVFQWDWFGHQVMEKGQYYGLDVPAGTWKTPRFLQSCKGLYP